MKIRYRSETNYIFLFAVALFYFSYRYIFQWANEVTSGSYSATPSWVQTGKYIIVIATMMLTVFMHMLASINVRFKTRGMVMFAIVLSFIISMYSFVIVRDQNTLIIMIEASIIFLMGITVPEWRDFYHLDKLFLAFINLNIVYEAVQIFLYIRTGRLPAIAWANAGLMQVRFGGVFDDPFAQSLFLGFVIPYVFHRFRGRKRAFYLVVSLVMLILTWTVTSILAIAATFCLKRVDDFIKGKKVRTKWFLLLMIIFVIGIALASQYGEQFMGRLLEVKGGSIAGHIQSFSLEGLSISTFLGLTPEAHYSESSLSRMLFTNGALFLVSYYLIGLRSASRSLRLINNTDEDDIVRRSIFYGMFYYQTSFLIGSINLPFTCMFFNGIVFSLFAGIIFASKFRNCLEITCHFHSGNAGD